jgi:hypothetical protein
MRAATAAERSRKGPAAALLAAILSLLEQLMALLAQFKTGTLAAHAAPGAAAPSRPAASATWAASTACAPSATPDHLPPPRPCRPRHSPSRPSPASRERMLPSPRPFSTTLAGVAAARRPLSQLGISVAHELPDPGPIGFGSKKRGYGSRASACPYCCYFETKITAPAPRPRCAWRRPARLTPRP